MRYFQRRLMTRTTAAVSLLCMSVAAASADEFTVRFRLHAPDLEEDADVYIAGSVPQLGNWNPRAVKMTRAGEHVWTHAITLDRPQTLEYKYTRGSWAIEAADEKGQPLKNLTVKVDASKDVEDRVDVWTKPKPRAPRVVQGQITGSVRYHRDLPGDGLVNRDVIVWLPPDYESSGRRYPVLYMHDGQNVIDPNTSAFGVDWQVDEACTRLIGEGKMPPLIVVGIYNTPERSREYLPGPTGTAYMTFLTSALKPMIDREYRTEPTRENTFIGGSSYGGLCSFMLVWEQSDVFSKAICMSPAFRVGKREGGLRLDYVATVENGEPPPHPIAVYIDNGGVGVEENLQSGIDAMLEALETKGFERGKNLWWVHAPEARHTESAWAERFPEAIMKIFSEPQPSDPNDRSQ